MRTGSASAGLTEWKAAAPTETVSYQEYLREVQVARAEAGRRRAAARAEAEAIWRPPGSAQKKTRRRIAQSSRRKQRRG